MSVEAAVVAVLSELDGILTFREEQKAELEAFLGGQRVFNFNFGQSLVKRCGASRFTTNSDALLLPELVHIKVQMLRWLLRACLPGLVQSS